MTVADLIELLKTFPQDAQVVAENDRSDISIVGEKDVVYSDNRKPKDYDEEDWLPRRFHHPGGEFDYSNYYTNHYVEISGCATW